VLNHEEGEDRVRQYIQWKRFPEEEPIMPFSDDELGIMYLDDPAILDQ
jgi:hypothetical protein